MHIYSGPAGLWTQQSQRRDVAQLRVGRSSSGRNVVGGSEKFSHGIVRSQKPLLTVTPFIVDDCYTPIQPCIILAGTRWNPTSPDPQLKALTTSY